MGFSNAEINRYIRHFAVDRIGLSGQAVLKKSSVICVGAGGLGCGALPYLVSCGVGAVGLIDHDVVELSNLQRQVLYTEKDIGRSKAVAAKNRLISLNDCVSVQAINQKLTQENATDLLKNYDLVIDGSDNFSTRYLVNDVCHQLKKPLVSAAVFQFTAQLFLLDPRGPCYRCLYPMPPSPDLVPNCSQAGVLGTVPGSVGALQANEAIKLLLKLTTLRSTLMLIDLLDLSIKKIKFHEDPACSLCQPNAVAAKPLNYFDESPNFSSVVEITVKALPTALSEGKILLDVREDWERELSSIPNSLHMPLSQFDAANLDPSAAYIIYCKSGKRSAQACLKAAALKLDAVSLSGGINAYLAEPVPS